MSEETTQATTTTPAPAKKWTSEAGPRMNEQVRDAHRNLCTLHKTFTEITGIIDGEKHEHTYYSPFSPNERVDVTEAITAIGDKHGWKVTRENYKTIVADYREAYARLKQNPPVIDKRVTAEVEAERQAKWEAYQAEKREEARVRDENLAKLKAEEQARKQARAVVDSQNREPVQTGAASVKYNPTKNGVEIQFPAKPSSEVLAELKGAGFHWSRFNKVWYKRIGSYAWATAHRIAGITEVPPLPKSDRTEADEAREADAAYVQAQEDAYIDAQARAIGA